MRDLRHDADELHHACGTLRKPRNLALPVAARLQCSRVESAQAAHILNAAHASISLTRPRFMAKLRHLRRRNRRSVHVLDVVRRITRDALPAMMRQNPRC